VALAVAASPVRAQGPADGPSPADVLEAARRAAEGADQAMNTVGLILSFFEVAGVIATLLIGIAALAGFRTINEYRAELNKARAELNAMRTELGGMRADLVRETDNVLQSFEKRVTEGLEGIRQQAEQFSAFEARLDAGLHEVRERGDLAIRALTVVQLGEQQMEMRNWSAALRTFEEAYRLDPQNRAVNYFLGELYIMQRDLKRGEEHLRKAQADGEIYPPAEAALAYVLRLQGDHLTDVNDRNYFYAQAERRFLNAVKHDPLVRDINGESVYGMLGGLYRRQGRMQDALRCYEQAERITPHNCYPVYNLALLHFQHNDAEKARAYFERVVDLALQQLKATPSDFWARFNLITAYAALGQTEAAYEHLDILLETGHILGPLESFQGGLKALQDTANPPPGLEPLIARVEEAIARLKTP
jgi:tetratricopeptide (TPR) repeat protein